jgi:predicted nucleic acid-binding protein
VPENAWVMNASPLILYARINRLDLIEAVAPILFVPKKVIDEVRGGLWKDDSAQIAVEWAMPRIIPDAEVPVSVEHWDVGPGESQVITHCINEKRWAVLDDRMARRCAKAHNISVIGSLGIVLRAKRCGAISKARPLIYKLKSAGMYVADDLIVRCLAAIDEQ